MTYSDWIQQLGLIIDDMQKVQKDLKKLDKCKNPNKCRLLAQKIKVNLACVKKMYNMVAEQYYWHKAKVNQERWLQFQKDIEAVFKIFEEHNIS